MTSSTPLDLSGVDVYGGYAESANDSGTVTTSGNSIYASGITKVNSINNFDALTLNLSDINLANGSDASANQAKAVLQVQGQDLTLSSVRLTASAQDGSLAGTYALLYSAGGLDVSTGLKVSRIDAQSSSN